MRLRSGQLAKRKLLPSLALCLFGSAVASAAAGCSQPVTELVPSGCLEVGAAAIYQQACVNHFTVMDGVSGAFGPFFVLQPAASQQVNQLFDIDPKAYWGFEVWVGWKNATGCERLSILYKRLHSYRDGKTWSNFGNFLGIEVNHLPASDASTIAFVRANQRTRYDSLRLRFAENLACKCCSRLYLFFGGRYLGAEIGRHIFVQATETDLTSTVDERTRFDGGGIEFGLGADRQVGYGLGLVGTLSGVALFGNRQDEFGLNNLINPLVIPPQVTYSKRHFTKCVPGMDLRAGISYSYDMRLSCFCFRLVGEVGWEMDYFWNILGLRLDEFDSPISDTDQGTNTVNFGTSGLYLALSIVF